MRRWERQSYGVRKSGGTRTRLGWLDARCSSLNIPIHPSIHPSTCPSSCHRISFRSFPKSLRPMPSPSSTHHNNIILLVVTQNHALPFQPYVQQHIFALPSIHPSVEAGNAFLPPTTSREARPLASPSHRHHQALDGSFGPRPFQPLRNPFPLHIKISSHQNPRRLRLLGPVHCRFIRTHTQPCSRNRGREKVDDQTTQAA
ncbi:hypothetical protein BKA80DRAFT_77322 [Phyllosticta citrichinensis]